jgi:membrane protein
MKYVKRAKEVIFLILRDVERKHLLLIAAGLAYYFLMSLFPALLFITALMAYAPLEEALRGADSFLTNMIGPQNVSTVHQMLGIVTPHRRGLLSFGIITTLWLTSKGTKAVIWGFDIVYEAHASRSLWITRILAFGLTFAVAFLLFIGVVVMLVGPALEAFFARIAPVQTVWLEIWPYLQWLLTALFTFAAIELLYLFAPNVPRAHRRTIPGAVIATATWLILSWGLSLYFYYFGNLKLDKLYGIFATPIALMTWLYWSAVVLLMGAQVNSTLQRYRKLGQGSSFATGEATGTAD